MAQAKQTKTAPGAKSKPAAPAGELDTKALDGVTGGNGPVAPRIGPSGPGG